MTLIRSTTTRQLAGDAAVVECRARYGFREISDECAVTVAAWWQSPGRIGRHLATLASGLPVDYDDLRTDIAATRLEADTPMDRICLDMLATWAMDKAREIEGRE